MKEPLIRPVELFLLLGVFMGMTVALIALLPYVAAYYGG